MIVRAETVEKAVDIVYHLVGRIYTKDIIKDKLFLSCSETGPDELLGEYLE